MEDHIMKVYLNPEQSAVIVVDIQNDFCHEEGMHATLGRDVTRVQDVTPNIEQLVLEARSRKISVIFTQHVTDEHTINRPAVERWKKIHNTSDDPPFYAKKGSWGAEFYKLSPSHKDIVVQKNRPSGFFGTTLNMILKNYGITSLILTGVSTNICVESTARDGAMLNYSVSLVKDGCASYHQELHEATVANIEFAFGRCFDTSEIMNYWRSTEG